MSAPFADRQLSRHWSKNENDQRIKTYEESTSISTGMYSGPIALGPTQREKEIDSKCDEL
jgi:hypothetical protein